jgi:cyclopropane fatty-acyl-phospholipid synthase-like methyltransferase
MDEVIMPAGPTSYDLVAYPGYAHPQTHPDRLAVIGSLFGLDPARVTHCRVLELGCGNGSNLVPMAWGLPKSEFTGIDLAARPIAQGRQMIRELGLSNVRLVHGNITEIAGDWGKFDYVIAHGLFSWVPAQVREHLLTLCHDRLAPQGIAFVSYNA